MSAKKILIGAKPTVNAAAEEWVQNREVQASDKEANKRLTIDIPESLHRAIKIQCAERGNRIADEVRELLLQKYGKQ
ncbi:MULTISPECIES: hypothetical protein [Pseudomonas]|uniref:Plasmid segregation centromere-binding protein ParG n=13 Tax=Pseudomonas syringae group TaxID=136849 RepID=A0A2K4X3A3_PSESX|nr:MULTISPECIES: hypothetical protein [Pseudomonas]KPW68707.1 hypothetical protein ALO82_200206 [Pseudomonas syringae pv. broussonetiae]KAA3532629.1 hypothetical protein DXU85_28955 [Pseudomonas savastanoi]KPW79298.1 hypothetical protein ALO76_200064 [Pseudomonas syringae pv. coriandricola]KPW98705.1 hypothetical protein ALO50_200122 [Pseudomonas syringae pv. cerasicola]KPX13707.1 hypothetical protein ALO73_200182 [Pseudomonas syringae pv. daphniphylli]